MKPSLFFRTSSTLLFVLALCHLGSILFTNSSSDAANQVFEIMGKVHSDSVGESRNFGDLYTGSALLLSVFSLLSALLAWHLGGLSDEVRRRSQNLILVFAMAHLINAVVYMRYFSVSSATLGVLVVIFLAIGTASTISNQSSFFKEEK